METQQQICSHLIFSEVGGCCVGHGSLAITRGPEVGYGVGEGGWEVLSVGESESAARGQSCAPHQPSERKRA